MLCQFVRYIPQPRNLCEHSTFQEYLDDTIETFKWFLLKGVREEDLDPESKRIVRGQVHQLQMDLWQEEMLRREMRDRKRDRKRYRLQLAAKNKEIQQLNAALDAERKENAKLEQVQRCPECENTSNN